MLGVQIQGNQFRICAQWNSKHLDKDIDSLYGKFKGSWFDDNFDKNKDFKTILNHKTSMKPRGNKKYDCYITDNYFFIYQYFDIDETNNDYNTLIKMIRERMEIASNIIINMHINNIY